MEKITKKERFAQIREVLADGGYNDLVAFIDHEVELLTRKNASRSNKPTKSATETAEVAEVILANMPTGTKMTATEIQNAIPELAGKSNQRMTASLKVLMNTGFIENVKEKGKSYFIRK